MASIEFSGGANNFYVYAHCKPDGAFFYIGKGVDGRAYNMNGRNKWHAHIIKKYGRENIKIEILKSGLSECSAHEEEIKLISLYGRRDNQSGILCNLTDGGEGISNPSQESRLKISNSQKGRKRTPEQKLLMSERQKRIMSNPDARNRIIAALIGKRLLPESITKRQETRRAKGITISKEHLRMLHKSRVGAKHTQETKEKISNAHTGRHISVETRLKMSASHIGKITPPEVIAKRLEKRSVIPPEEIARRQETRLRNAALQGKKY